MSTVLCCADSTAVVAMYAVVQAARAAEAERKRAEAESASIVAPEAVRASDRAGVSASAAASAESDTDDDIVDEDHAEYKQLANELDQMESPPMSPQPSLEAQNAAAASAIWPAASSSSQPLPQLPPSTLISFADIQTALTYYLSRALLVDEVTELRLLLHTHQLSDGVTLELLTEILNTIKDQAAAAIGNDRDEQEEEASRSSVNPVAVFARALRDQSRGSLASPQQHLRSSGLSDDSLSINSTGSAPSLLSSASSASLAAALQRAQKENQRLSHQFTMLRDHNARTEAQLTEASEEQQALHHECKKLRDAKEDLVAELQRTKAMSMEAAAKAQAASSAAAQAHAELQALRKSHGVVQHRAEIARHASTKYETQLTHARRNSISQIEAAREAATREAAFAQARILAENETLKAQLADLEAQFAAYQSEQTALAECAAAAESIDSPDRDRFLRGEGDYDRASAFSPDFDRVRRIGATASPNNPTDSDATADAASSASPASAAALFEYLRSIQAKSQGKGRHGRSGGGSGGSGGSNGSRHSSSHSGTDLSGLLSPLGEEEHEPEHDGGAEKLSSIDQQQMHDEEVARISGHNGSNNSSHSTQLQSKPVSAVALVTADTQTDLSMLQDDAVAAVALDSSSAAPSVAADHQRKGKKGKKSSAASAADDPPIDPEAARAEIDSLKQSLAALRAEQDRWTHDRAELEKQLAAATAVAANAAAAAASSSLAVPASPGGGHTRSLSSSAAASAHSPALRNKTKGKQKQQQANGATHSAIPSADVGVEQAASASAPAAASAAATPVASDSAVVLACPAPAVAASAASPRPTAPTRRPLPRSLVDPAVFLAATIQSAPVSAAPSQPSSGRGSPSMNSTHRSLPPTGLALSTEVTPPKTRHSTLVLNGITMTPQSARQHTPPALSNLSSQAAFELGFERGLHAQGAAATVASASKQPAPPQPSGGKGGRSRASQSTAAAASSSTRLLMTPTTAAALARDLGHQPLSPLSQLKSKILQPPTRSHRRSRSSNAAIPESASTVAESPFASPVATAAIAKDLFASDPDYAAASADEGVIVTSPVLVCADDADAASFERDLAFALAVTAASAESAAAVALTADSSSASAGSSSAKTKGGKTKARGAKSAAAASSSLEPPAASYDPTEAEPLTPPADIDAAAAAEEDDDAPGWAPAADWPARSAAAAVPAFQGKKKKGSTAAAATASSSSSVAAAPSAVKSKKGAAAASSSSSRSSAAAPVVSARLAADLRAIAAVTSLDSKLLDGAPKLQPALYHAAPIMQCSIL